ncbi:MAG: glycosyltransferase family 4 protein [Desulfobacteraceae bacterium]|uniref:Glycosyltransferase family 4 protein n=1 Tax=Candidatus Desulfaltia bathyphila TaxID=2841697 RepID=A0A8J6TAR2_9BACT|nr:glycosyltransferase family 4 protein [Candidatus Desulfaltia bathyphila]
MILGIDASNIRSGGGITHLSEVSKCAQPHDFGFKRVIAWGGTNPLSRLRDQSWLEKIHVPILDSLLPQRVWWQQFILPKLLKQHNCALLFSPGGTLPKRVSVPTVTMSQNLLPLAMEEAARYETVSMKLRLKLLNTVQRMSFQKADGLIFLTQYAKKSVCEQLKKKPSRTAIVPHGINKDFFLPPRKQKPLDSYSQTKPFRLLYVSNVDVYKHQWHVAEAVAALIAKGFPVAIDFVGSFYPQAMRRFKKTVQRMDSNGSFINYKGFLPYNKLSEVYQGADAFVFASSCENMPNILLEAMAAGLPIACSKFGPMPEVLGNGGVYFDPESPYEIAEALRTLVESIDLREHCASTSYNRAKKYSWERCARETFSFLAEVVHSKCQSTDYDK